MTEPTQPGNVREGTGSEWSRYNRAFADWVKKADAALIRQVLQDKGVDISDHRPERLQVIDRSLGPHFRDQVKRKRSDYESSAIAIGCYLGQVMVYNLGARWHVPNYLQTLAALVLAQVNPIRTERYVYLSFGAQKVYVLQAAREAIDKTAAEFSLYEFYLHWADATAGRGPQPPEH